MRMSRNSDEIDAKLDNTLHLKMYTLDLSKKELRTNEGALVPLRAQSAEVLVVLGRRPDEVVGKDELINEVWNNTFVADDSLVQCIVEIRRGLGKEAHEIIETFPKKGYRLNVFPLKKNDLDGPAKPAIIVLPFVNISGDPDQEFFADGMTGDVIAGLSNFRSLFVIARNSSFFYKNKSPDVRDVARHLGVRYVLEGSVRRSGDRLRITGQLVDALTGSHLWAEHYDRQFEDVFVIQDEITERIVASIAPEVDFFERQRALRKSPENLGVWGLYQRGLESHQSALGDECKSVIEQFDRVCELDPSFASGFAMAASSRVRYALLFEPDDRKVLLDQALEKSRRGIALDSRDSTCLWAHGRALSLLGKHNAAISSMEAAISVNPNDSMAHYFLAMALGSAGRLIEAVSSIDQAIRLNPHDVSGGGFTTYKAFLMFDLERYEEALECAQCAIRQPYPLSIPFEITSAALVKLKRPEEARIALKDLLGHTPETSISKLSERPWIGRSEAKGRFLDALGEAGLPKS